MSASRALVATAALYEPGALALAAGALASRLDAARPAEIIAEARLLLGRDRIAAVSSFGAESAVLLKAVAEVDPAIPVLFVDTGWLFEETLAYRDELVRLLGLTDVRTIGPSPAELARDPDRDLWQRDGDGCCGLRKVAPLRRALARFDGWINGRKRCHGADRAAIPVVETDGHRLKFNPLAHASEEDIAAAFRQANLPQHPLTKHGFASIGCMPCTTRSLPGEASRAGRWRGSGKTECGIHAAPDGIVPDADRRIVA